MSNTRNLADLLDTSGDIKSAALDNVPATDISGKLNLSGGTLTGALTIESTDDTSSAGPIMCLYRNSASPDDGDYLGQIKFQGESDTGVTRLFAKITAKTSDVSNGTEDGLIETAVKVNGANVIVSRQTGSALKLINGVNLEVDGNIVVGGTVDGIDIATRDAVLTSTTTTAGAALPKAGGTMTGDIAHAGTLTLDMGSEIILDTDDGVIRLRDSGGDIGMLQLNSSNDFIIRSMASDKDLVFKGSDGGSVIEAMRIDMSAGGNVGIGATAPNYKLQIHDTGTSYLQITNGTTGTGSSDGAYFGFANADSTLRIINQENSGIRLSTNNTERMFITSSGNVGIGTSSPATQLHIENSGGNASAQLTSGTSGTSYINMGDTGNADAGQISYLNNADNMAFVTNASERMRINASGRVGIANTNPQYKLDVTGDAKISSNLIATSRNAAVQCLETIGPHYNKRFVKYTTGSSSTTVTLMKYARYWWGQGHTLITIRRTYYGANSDYGQFLIDGHTRSGLPSIRTIYNAGVSTPVPANYSASSENCDINYSLGAYRHIEVTVEAYNTVHEAAASSVGANNSYHVYNSQEVI